MLDRLLSTSILPLFVGLAYSLPAKIAISPSYTSHSGICRALSSFGCFCRWTC